jgi:hypothetical protein
MTTEQKEGNAVIAGFMGKTVYPIEGTPEYKKWKGQAHDYEWHQLKYHSSWDWQIPVWSKVWDAIKDYNIGNMWADNYRASFRERYELAVRNNDPKQGAEIIIAAITWHNSTAQ